MSGIPATEYDVQRYDTETERMNESHRSLIKELVQSGLVYTSATGLGIGVAANTTLFKDTRITHFFLVWYASIGFCAFLVAKIAREFRVGTYSAILGAWMAAAMVVTSATHKVANDVKYQVLIACFTCALVVLALLSVEFRHEGKMGDRKRGRPVIGVVAQAANP
ncbi:hypothetical protein Tco_0233836 [Tanacetum coccineum]